jgi:ElaB/YqjD/DUF883 family membrane-anchored ribosome-binding protein
MSSSYTSPRVGGTKPASTEEISTQENLAMAIRNNPFAAVGIAAGIGFLYAMIRR